MVLDCAISNPVPLVRIWGLRRSRLNGEMRVSGWLLALCGVLVGLESQLQT